MLVDADGRLAGLFTDSDLARLFERHDDGALDRPIAEVMTRHPVTLARTARVAEAVDVLRARKISELPVVDADGRPVGMLDITDLIGLDPETAAGTRPVLRLAEPLAASEFGRGSRGCQRAVGCTAALPGAELRCDDDRWTSPPVRPGSSCCCSTWTGC